MFTQAHDTDGIDLNTHLHTPGRAQHCLQLAHSYAESKGVSAAASALESKALKTPTGVTSDCHMRVPSVAKYSAAAASDAPASAAAAASTAAGDISITALMNQRQQLTSPQLRLLNAKLLTWMDYIHV